MKLQGRNLTPNMRGDDVRLLQTELRQLGFDIPDELGFFDSTTFIAVKEFQQQHNLPTNGIVDAKTARAIHAELDGLPREGYLVTGQVVRTLFAWLLAQRRQYRTIGLLNACHTWRNISFNFSPFLSTDLA